jgi:hypothetical protein
VYKILYAATNTLRLFRNAAEFNHFAGIHDNLLQSCRFDWNIAFRESASNLNLSRRDRQRSMGHFFAISVHKKVTQRQHLRSFVGSRNTVSAANSTAYFVAYLRHFSFEHRDVGIAPGAPGRTML